MPKKQPTPPQWDLSDLYKSASDPRVAKDQKRIADKASVFEEKNRGSIKKSTSTTQLKRMLDEYAAILEGVHILQAFARLQLSVHTTSEKYNAFVQRIDMWAASIWAHTTFFELELIALPKKNLEKYIQSEELAEYAHYLRKQLDWKPHRLSEREEVILQDKQLTGRQAFIRLYDQEASAQQYEVQLGKSSKTMNQSQALSLWHSPNRAHRRAAAEALAEGTKSRVQKNAFMYNTVCVDFALDQKYRGFARPEDYRHLTNEVSHAEIEAMATAVTSNYRLVREHYNLKRELLGETTLYEYDKYAPISKRAQTVTFDEARDIVVDSFTSFSPLFGEIANEFFEKKWIDAAPADGKQGGAFCYYVTPDKHPYVLMNFTGTIRDVLVLAHELGHGIHAYLARRQSYLHYDWPLTIAETASVFGEMIVFGALRNKLKTDKQRLALYVSKVEDIFASVFRQTMMYRFEQDFHSQRAERGDVSVQDASKIWMRHTKKMFGSSVHITENEQHWWSVIPHFIHYPFYVYAYSFGELLTLSLYAMYEQGREGFVDTYLDLLSAGGSMSPQKLLEPFGVDLRDESFWQGGIAEIKKLIAEEKRLAKNG